MKSEFPVEQILLPVDSFMGMVMTWLLSSLSIMLDPLGQGPNLNTCMLRMRPLWLGRLFHFLEMVIGFGEEEPNTRYTPQKKAWPPTAV